MARIDFEVAVTSDLDAEISDLVFADVKPNEFDKVVLDLPMDSYLVIHQKIV